MQLKLNASHFSWQVSILQSINLSILWLLCSFSSEFWLDSILKKDFDMKSLRVEPELIGFIMFQGYLLHKVALFLTAGQATL